VDEPRLTVYHRDLPLYRDAWSSVDSGLPDAQKSRLAAIAAPPPGLRVDATYRISYPFRVHPGEGRVFVFATNELDSSLAADCVGADGTAGSVDCAAVRIVTPSTWSRRAFLQAGYPAERVHVVPHGADAALAAPLPAAERRRLRTLLGIADSAFAFLNIGAMSWNKGIGPLIAAFAVHRRSFPNSVLILKGGDALYGNVLRPCVEEAGRLRREARDPGLAAGLRYIAESLPLRALAALYRAADAYVAPYRAEGFNLPVLEAMASSLPVIVTHGGSTDDFCPDDAGLKITADLAQGPRGRYLEPRIDELVDHMARMIEEPAARDSRARSALHAALPRYSWPSVTRRLTELLVG
jgi:glycosyltransferase involved in cell wall biosynthesis